jgi:NAD(P)-dependent dehydrogenase (short-subunit alcohol dehydrogenase family)
LGAAAADDFGHVASAIRAQLGRLDALVHTAAFLGSLGPVEHQSFDAWQKVLAINLAAAMAMTRSTLPLLANAPDASVVFTLDARGEEPRAYWGAYAAAKSGCRRSPRRSPTSGRTGRRCGSTPSCPGRYARRFAR